MSRERLALPAGLVSFRAAPGSARPAAPTGAVAGGSSGAAEPQSGGGAAGLSAADLKALQRRAFERGEEVAKADFAARFTAAFAAAASARAALEAARDAERAAVWEFAVDLAVGLAEEIVGAALRDGLHDVRALVGGAVEEALPAASGSPVVAHLAPEDLATLESVLAARPSSATPGVRYVADATLPRGACRVSCDGAEISADPSERLRAAAERLRRAAKSALQERGHDAL